MIDKTNTPDELLDLVDENDQIIGEVLKGKANKNPNLFHREIAVIIYDDKGRILFQQRSKKKSVNPGIWSESCAGHIPKGMKPIDAAHMELKEELGFDTDLKFVGKTLGRQSNETHFTYWYVGKLPKGTKIKIERKELEQIRFLSQKELDGLVASGEKYGQRKYGGQTVDMVKKFWQGKL